MDWVNRYSYPLVSIVIVLALGGIAWARPENAAPWSFAALLVAAAALIFWVLTRRGHLTPSGPEKRVRRMSGNGRPVVVHFYSDTHAGSLLARPFTAAVENAYRSRCEFIHIEMSHREAEPVANWLEAGAGDFVLIDGTGTVVDRVSLLTAAKLDALLERPAHR